MTTDGTTSIRAVASRLPEKLEEVCRLLLLHEMQVSLVLVDGSVAQGELVQDGDGKIVLLNAVYLPVGSSEPKNLSALLTIPWHQVRCMAVGPGGQAA